MNSFDEQLFQEHDCGNFDGNAIKALGKFLFQIQPNEEHRPLSKRILLSELGSLFDPLGLLSQ